jgi:hypothetical protein
MADRRSFAGEMTFTMPQQSRKRPSQKSRRAQQKPKMRHSRIVEFPEAKGQTIERVELNTDPDFPCINIRFQNETDLTFIIGTELTFRADYSRWKDGNQKVLKRWPVLRSEGI